MYSTKFDALLNICGDIIASTENLGLTRAKLMEMFPDKESDVSNFVDGVNSLWWDSETVKGIPFSDLIDKHYLDEWERDISERIYDDARDELYNEIQEDIANEVHLNGYSKIIKAWRESKGFHTPDDFSDAEGLLAKIALVHSELGEASEAIRHQDEENFKEELADTIIRILDITGTLDIDIESEIVNKMRVNMGREHKHGKVI